MKYTVETTENGVNETLELYGMIYKKEWIRREKGKKREHKLPVLLSRCPFCGEPYDEKKKS